MRRILLALATLALVAFSTAPSWAGGGYYYGQGRGGFGRCGPGYGYSYYNFGADSPHDAAVRRIMATHSRFRYWTHPRSQYNSPPHPYDYIGWDRRW